MIDKDFWETKHTIEDGWLTGTSLTRLLGFFNLSNDHVANIGFGDDYDLRQEWHFVTVKK